VNTLYFFPLNCNIWLCVVAIYLSPIVAICGQHAVQFALLHAFPFVFFPTHTTFLPESRISDFFLLNLGVFLIGRDLLELELETLFLVGLVRDLIRDLVDDFVVLVRDFVGFDDVVPIFLIFPNIYCVIFKLY